MSLLKKIHMLLGNGGPKQSFSEPILKKKVAKNPVNKSNPNLNRKITPGPEVITKKENMPNYEKIISYSNEEIPLNSDQRRNYIVLLEDSKNSKVTIVCSSESNSKSKIDNTYLTIKNKCVSKGYKVRQLISPRQIIQITYENDEKNKGIDSTDRARKDGFVADFDKLIGEALSQKVSDVHFEIRRKDARVRFRKHGEVFTYTPWTVTYARDMSSVVYQVMADEKEPSFIESKPQAARIERTIAGVDIAIRLNTLSASGGFDVSMRILKLDDESQADRVIDTLGYDEQSIKEIYRAMSRPTGVIIIAGTTGSGKSTSLSTMLNTVIREKWGDDGPKIRVITVEDPTEYTIIGATQHGVVRNRNKPDENPFAEAMKAAMRCDPDILMVGEVRDHYSATLLAGAVQSGHTVFTTVHAASAIGIIPRLISFGITPETLGSSDFISCLIYQTLLPVTCNSCSISFKDFKNKAEENNDKKSLALIKRVINAAEGADTSKVKFRNRNKGGHKCSNPECVNGVVGRSVVAEVVSPNPLILSAFEQGSVNLAKYYHIKMGGRLIRDHAVDKVLAGISDPRDAEEKVDLLDNKINLNLLERSLNLSDDMINTIEIEVNKMGLGPAPTTKKSSTLGNNVGKRKKERFQSELLNDRTDFSQEKDAEVITLIEKHVDFDSGESE